MDILIKCNVGSRERIARMALGTAAGVGALLASNKGAKVALGGLSLVGLGTAMSRYCPINQLAGINNCQPAYRSLAQLMRRI